MRNHLDAILRQRAEAAKRIYPPVERLAQRSVRPDGFDRPALAEAREHWTAKTVHTERPDAEWKKAVLRANGNQCSWVEAGERCKQTTATTDLQPRRYGSKDPERCIALCPEHAEATE